MFWSYRTRNCITSVITPPDTPSPTTSVGTPSPDARPPSTEIGWNIGGHVNTAPSWWQRDPRRLRHSDQKPLTASHQQPKHPAGRSDDQLATKRNGGLIEYQKSNNQPKRVKVEVQGTEEVPKDQAATYINDLLSRLITKGLLPGAMVKSEDTEDQTKNETEPNAVKVVDLEDPESLRVAQPGLVAALYAGTQCSGCSTRFPTKDTTGYSQHLDWHFRQNKRAKVARRKAQSRPWHYSRSDWLQFEEVEDLDQKEKCWFDISRVQKPKVDEVPSVVAGAIADDHCSLCGDKFDTFYSDEDDEWHLRNCLRYNGHNFHPDCLESHKVSMHKPILQSDAVVKNNKCEEPTELSASPDDGDVVLVEEPVPLVVVVDDE